MILTESRFGQIETVTEGIETSKKLYLQGIFLESEQKNRNGRIYQKKEIESAVKKVNEAASQGRHILGELDHPSNLVVSLSNVSHKIVEMQMSGNNAIGKALILESTPKGQIAKGLVEAGVNLGVSSRGAGVVNESTNVVEGFVLETVDIVANPSAIEAYPQSVMEALEMAKNGYVVDDLSNAVLHDKSAQKYFQKELMKFIKNSFN
jgi:Kyanoviridae head maturation protease